MGRDSTGATTVNNCLALPVSSFAEIIKSERFNLHHSITWQNGASIGFILKEENGIHILELDYHKTVEGEKVPIRYRIWIIGRPSNLGTGTVYFFLYPFTRNPCRKLFMAYGSHYFKSREAYRIRIYYASQLSSRLDRHIHCYFRLTDKLEKLHVKHPKSHYKGKETRAQQRLKSLERKKRYHDHMRWRVLPVAVARSLSVAMGTDVSDLF